MDREILFRAKIDTDAYSYDKKSEWVYGYYTKYSCIFSGRSVIEQENDDYAVLDETVCQYTGLTDKNGTKIFEGDIIQSYHHREPMGVAVIYWQGSSFWCDLLSGSQFNCCDTLDDWDCECSLEIIGNVFDDKDIVDAREWSSDGEWLGDKT